MSNFQYIDSLYFFVNYPKMIEKVILRLLNPCKPIAVATNPVSDHLIT